MAIHSQLDLMFRDSGASSSGRMGPVFRADRALDSTLIRQAQSVSRHRGWDLHQGVYVGLTGPSYETRAEYRMLRRLGGDAVGMSTIPEIVVASEYEIPTLAVSIITNLALPDAPRRVSGHDVLRVAGTASEHLRTVFEDAIRTA
jgi:purine-nucleoside phosphorylase